MEVAGNLDMAVTLMVSVFHNYSNKEGDKHKLSKPELKNLLKNELPMLLSPTGSESMADDIMRDLDNDRDGEVDFVEFMRLVGSLAVACHEMFVKLDCENRQ